jgi:hypothetical protein
MSYMNCMNCTRCHGYNKFKREYRDARDNNFIDAKKPTGLSAGFRITPYTITTDSAGRTYIKILAQNRQRETDRNQLKAFPGYRLIGEICTSPECTTCNGKHW